MSNVGQMPSQAQLFSAMVDAMTASSECGAIDTRVLSVISDICSKAFADLENDMMMRIVRAMSEYIQEQTTLDRQVGERQALATAIARVAAIRAAITAGCELKGPAFVRQPIAVSA